MVGDGGNRGMLTYQDVGLSAYEEQEIMRLLGRRPNELELGLFGALWSEHCSYKSSKNLLAQLPHQGRFVVQGPGGNAGVVQLSADWDVAFKIESHNHPSFVEPLQGAATGVGGILRDIVAMGARPIAIADILKFGTNEKAPALLHGVVEGIGAYGNAIGIPNVTGSLGFSAVYDANPLVNVLAVGIRRHGLHVGADGARPGSVLILIGQGTGRDGIHGASLLASHDFGAETEEMRPTVQVGDPFMGKLLMEATLAIVDKGLSDAVQDLGAAGLTSSTAELAYASSVGLEIDVSQVICREANMSPYEVMLSETQERMLLSVPKHNLAAVLEILAWYELPYAQIGQVMAGDFLRVVAGDQVLAELPTSVLVGGCPRVPVKHGKRMGSIDQSGAVETGNLELAWGYQVLGHADCRDRASVYQRYDSMIGIRTVWGPEHDVAVMHLENGSPGICIAVAAPARWAEIDSYSGGIGAVAAALSLVATQGAVPLGLTDGINAGNPEKPEAYDKMAALIQGIGKAAEIFEVPVTGGNVSLHNETEGRAIWPTAAIGVVARHPSPEHPMADTPPYAGARVLILNPPTKPDLGGSVLAEILGRSASYPTLDVDAIQHSVHFLAEIVPQAEHVGLLACRAVGVGGLFVTVAKSLIDKNPMALGAHLNLAQDVDARFVFNEMAGQWVLFVDPKISPFWDHVSETHGVSVIDIGSVTDSPELVLTGGRTLTWPLIDLKRAYRKGGVRDVR
ncbi:MAG: phosphoribosylformylglycinamidine synthase subunit PurL [Sulfobacillus benefaciens]|uniref:Phosphoribosylformylglycinamidine synthase subunit PurL n=1 Tax=Sulfobacillus benefaciens TaxID=453960 RepID=A0A2T2XF68_9FIRM|nr:MAG: phosphoribosylformylglycinamidine synthase subunit PurL [Sulfobacillus benefaciens]